jgi:hypothetical protein
MITKLMISSSSKVQAAGAPTRRNETSGIRVVAYAQIDASLPGIRFAIQFLVLTRRGSHYVANLGLSVVTVSGRCLARIAWIGKPGGAPKGEML